MRIEAAIWIYWACCLATAVALAGGRGLVRPLLGPRASPAGIQPGYMAWLLVGWSTTLLAAGCYVLFTKKLQTGPYHLGDLVAFSFLNGVLEQSMFLFWFVAGCCLGRLLAPGRPLVTFACGYLGFAVYSGLIHGLFWLPVLPPHRPVALPMAALLTAMSFSWMWLFWRYRAVLAIIAMHVVADLLMMTHLHSTLFEPLSLA